MTNTQTWNDALQYVADTKMRFKPKLHHRIDQPLKAALLKMKV